MYFCTSTSPENQQVNIFHILFSTYHLSLYLCCKGIYELHKWWNVVYIMKMSHRGRKKEKVSFTQYPQSCEMNLKYFRFFSFVILKMFVIRHSKERTNFPDVWNYHFYLHFFLLFLMIIKIKSMLEMLSVSKH